MGTIITSSFLHHTTQVQKRRTRFHSLASRMGVQVRSEENSMQVKISTIVAVAFFLLLDIQFLSAVPQENTCSVPPDVQREIANTHPRAKIVSALDLDEDDRKFFE